MIVSRWQTKPPLGYRIDRGHPLAQGLVSFWAFNEGTGLPNDVASAIGPRPVVLGYLGNNTWTADSNGPVYRIGDPGNHSNAYANFTFGHCPDLTIKGSPLSAVWCGTMDPLQPIGGPIFQLSDSATTGTFEVQLLGTDYGLGDMKVISSNGTKSATVQTSAAVADANRRTYGVTFNSTGTNGFAIYRDGLPFGSLTIPYAPVLSAATTTGGLFAYAGTGSPSATGVLGLWNFFGLWYRDLSSAEHAAIAANPWQIFEPNRAAVAVYLGTPDFTVSPSPIPAGRSTATALALVGQASMDWVSGTTTFTGSGLAGTTITGQSITDTTHATVDVATGSTAGTLTITDQNGNRGAVQVVTAVITPSPTTIPADHAGDITIDLACNIGVWTVGSTTTFSLVNPPAGVTLVSQTVTSSTAASIVVTTGSGTGTLEISDGFETATVQVATPALAVGTAAHLGSTVTVGGTYTATATGTATVWTQATASSLFSVAGGTGASIASVTVNSDTSATFTLTAGTATGNLTITDTSTGTTAPITVAAAPAGSLHIGEALTLQHSGGTLGAFGGKNGAAIAFDFQADSNAGINLAAGIPIVDFATKPSGAPPVAAFVPALAGSTSTMVFSLYGTSGQTAEHFTVTMPIEIGVGYRFLLDWSVGTPSGNFQVWTSSGSNLIGVTGGTLQVGDAVAATGIPSGATVTSVIGGGVYQISGNASANDAAATLSVTRGTQTLYVNGLPYRTADIPYSTYAYSGLQFGANAGNDGNGNPVAADLQVANVALWSSSLTANDATGLAGGTLSPVDTSTPAAAWWPLAGGTVGQSPSLSDYGMSDLTTNGNTLSLVTSANSLANGAYAASIAAGSPVIVGAGVAKWGKSVYFGTSLTPTLNGANPLAAIASVNADPTVSVNGSAVQISGPLFNPNDNGVAVWTLECGSVDRIAPAIGGSGYVFPSVSWSGGGGGSGLTLGTPVMATGVVAYDIINGGSGLNSSPRVAIGDAAGTGTGATAIAMVNSSGQVAQVNLLTGGTGYTSPVVYIADGYGESLTVSRGSGNAIGSISVANGGQGYTTGTLAVAIIDSTGSGAIAFATASGGAITSITVRGGGSNYSANPTIVVYQPNVSLTGAQALATATASGGVVTGTRMTNMGSGYGAPPLVSVAPPPTWSGPTGDITATACVHVSNGSIDYVFPACGGLQGCGSGYTPGYLPYVLVGGIPGYGGTCGVNLAPTSIASVTIDYGGTSYTSSPAPVVNVSGGGMVGTPTASATVSGGAITAVTITGATFTSVPTITITGTTGNQAVVTAVLTGAAIGSVTIGANSPRDWTTTPLVTFTDPSGSATGATGTVTLAGTGAYGDIGSIAVNTGGGGYTLPSMTLTDPGISATAASIRPIVSNYIHHIPVTDGGGGFTAPPTITVTDPAGSGFVPWPIMTGVQSTDTVTYAAPASWLTPLDGGMPTGGVQAVSGAAVSNWEGQYEGATGGLYPIAVTPTMLGGVNVGSVPVGGTYDRGTFRNMLHKSTSSGAEPWIYQLGTTGTITPNTSDNVTPASWTRGTGNNGVIGTSFYALVGGNLIDQMGPPSHVGPWTLQYQDSQANTNDATAVWLYTTYPSNCTVTPVQLSGPTAGPVTMNSADITLDPTNSYIQSIGTANTSLGSGYEGAAVVITNSSGTPISAAAVAVVDQATGTISGFNVVSGGSGLGGVKPTVTVYGTKLAGNTVTAVFDVAYVTTPVNWTTGLQLGVAQVAGTYNLTEPWVATPASTNGNQAIDPTTNNSDLAVSQDIVKSLTGMGGNPCAGPYRWMDATMGLGGGTNYTDPADLDVIPATSTVWCVTETTTATFCYARYFNTDPSRTEWKQADGTPYASTKLYGTAGLFVSGVDAGFTQYGNTNLPSGTPYLSLPADDAGSFINAYYQWAVIELRSAQPHGFKTGQLLSVTAFTGYLVATVTNGGTGYSSSPTVTISGGTGTNSGAVATVSGGVITGITVLESCGYASGDTVSIAITDTSGSGATATIAVQIDFSIPTSSGATWASIGGSGQAVNAGWNAWVTGPYTILGKMFVGNGTTRPITPTVLSTTEIPISITVTRQIPDKGHVVPYEFPAASSNQLGGIYWCNLPPSGSDALYQAIAQRTAANIGPTADIWLEYGNENWNGAFGTQQWQQSTQNLLGYVPTGTTALTYFTGNGIPQPITWAINAANAFKACGDALVAAGVSASRIKRVYGSQWGTTNVTADVLQVVQQWGVPGVDYACVAPYIDTPAIAPIVRCFSPAGSWGSATGGAAGWPVDAINDAIRLLMIYSTKTQTFWKANQQACQNFGQPLTPFTGAGQCAQATANLTPTTIYAVAVVKPGSTYTSVADITLVGGGGTYTSATASMGVAATLTNGGANYTSPTVTLTGGGGTGAAITLTVTSKVVTGITVTPGSGYTSVPTYQITDSTGSGATLDLSLALASIAVTGSTGYTSTPTVMITGGGTATGQAYAVAALTPTSLAAPSLTSGGNNYAVTPEVTFTDGNGATLGTVTLNANGGVATVPVTNGGGGYVTTPAVSFTGGTGSGAQAVAIMSAGVVSQIVVTNPGSGYGTTPPTASLVLGSGATATATLTGSAVSALTLGSGGSGYTGTPNVNILGGSNLPAGTYYACYTFVDASNRETTVGLSRYGFGVNTINGFGSSMDTLTMPPWPPWAAKMNIYLTQTNGAPGTETLYTTINAADYGTGKTYPIGGPIGLGAALPSPMGVAPPTTNAAAPNIGQSLPQVVCYEGAIEIAIPAPTPFREMLLHDAFAHPSCVDRIWTWYSMDQTANPTAGAGSAAACYYQMYNDLSVVPYEWCLSYGNRQAPGTGTANRYVLPQGGSNFDGHDHNGGATPNEATAMQGFINWYSETTPTPTPTPTPTRRWFSGLRRPIMRLAS